jgi:chemotaxis signal transduction protein
LAEGRPLPDGPAEPEAGVNVVVVRVSGTELGIAVERIIDVVGAESPLQGALAAAGVAGTVALGGQATEVLDLAAAVSGV